MFLTPDRVNELVNQSKENLSNFQIDHPALDDAWYIIFTSGSTGEPKASSSLPDVWKVCELDII